MKFIKGILTDKDGSPSSKRVILFLLVLTFITIVFINVLMGKVPTQILVEQLFYLVLYTLATVFGENVTTIWNNKKSGITGGLNGGKDLIIYAVDQLPATGEPGAWYLFQGNYYYWSGTSFVNKGIDRPKDPPPIP